MKKYDLYLFDFDGTLLDTMSALEYVFMFSYNKVGIDFKQEYVKEHSRIPLSVGYELLKGDPNKYQDFLDGIEESLDSEEALHRNYPYEDSYEFFNYLKRHHVYAGIVTSNKIPHVTAVLEKLNIPLDIFDIYIGNRECEYYKPHPDPILKALEKANYQGDLSRVVYVGDGLNDTISANEAGVDAVLIDRVDAFPDSDKYIRIKSLMELFE